MSKDFDYLPRPDQFFPNLRRGHGSMHARRAGELTPDFWINHPKAGKCAAPGCKGDKHIDKQANIDDWCSDHGRDSNPLK